MKKIIVELKIFRHSKPVIMEIADNKTLSELIPVLTKVLGFPAVDSNNHKYYYWLEDISGNHLALSAYPSEARIGNQSVLIINRNTELPDVLKNKISPHPIPISTDVAKETSSELIARNISPQDLRGGLDVPPSWKEISVSKK